MRLILLYRPGDTLGGDQTATHAYARELRNLGVEVVERPAHEPGCLDQADFVQLWAACSPDWGLSAAYTVREAGKRLIVTPEWWGRELRQKFYFHDGEDLAPGYTQAVAQTLALAEVLFTATMSEAQECWKLVPRAKVHVVGHGCDPVKITPQASDDFVCCAARVEKHKNQVFLAHACRELGKPLILVGPIQNEAYAAAARGLGAETVGALEHASALQWMARARVHALVSFSESVGLATMEALQLGVPCVCGKVGAQVEYFGTKVTYADPTDWRDIAAAIGEAWDRPRVPQAVQGWYQVACKAWDWMEANR
jgi:glycosyltransferase involved in cell wall biosynthesis